MDNRCGSGHAPLAAESEEAAQTFDARGGAAAADSGATTGQPDAAGQAAPTGRHADTGIAVAAPGLSGHLRREAAGHGPDRSVIAAGQRPPETPKPQTDTGPTYGQPH